MDTAERKKESGSTAAAVVEWGGERGKKIINRDTFTSRISPLRWALSPLCFSSHRVKETKKNIHIYIYINHASFAVPPAASSFSSSGWLRELERTPSYFRWRMSRAHEEKREHRKREGKREKETLHNLLGGRAGKGLIVFLRLLLILVFTFWRAESLLLPIPYNNLLL